MPEQIAADNIRFRKQGLPCNPHAAPLSLHEDLRLFAGERLEVLIRLAKIASGSGKVPHGLRIDVRTKTRQYVPPETVPRKGIGRIALVFDEVLPPSSEIGLDFRARDLEQRAHQSSPDCGDARGPL